MEKYALNMDLCHFLNEHVKWFLNLWTLDLTCFLFNFFRSKFVPEAITAPVQDNTNTTTVSTQPSPSPSPSQNGRRRVTKTVSLPSVVTPPAPPLEVSKEYLEAGYLPEMVDITDETDDQQDQQFNSQMYDSQMDSNTQLNIFSKPAIKRARSLFK